MTNRFQNVRRIAAALGLGALILAGTLAANGNPHHRRGPDCDGLPSHAEFEDILSNVVEGGDNGGLANPMWGGLVNRAGQVCAIAFSGDAVGDQFPGSRTIAVAKANTANAFSLPIRALSTGQLNAAVQPEGPVFNLQAGNPIDTEIGYGGKFETYGTERDPMVGEKLGGTITFGGGLALYDRDGKLLGALGVSGDSSCTDHIIAWKMRHGLNLDNTPGAVEDNITVAGGYPDCGGGEAPLLEALPVTFPTGSQL